MPGWLVEELHTFAVGGEATHLYKRFCRRSDKLDGLPESPLLYVPSHTSRALDADLEAAGIAKHGPGGKIDFHACRVAFINLVLENQKVTPREAQELARHATTELTMNVYGRVRQDRLSQIVEEVGEFLRPAEPQVVPGLYRAAVGSELKSATSSPTRDCASNQLVEAAGIEPASEDVSPEMSTCVVDRLFSPPAAPTDRIHEVPAQLSSPSPPEQLDSTSPL